MWRERLDVMHTLTPIIAKPANMLTLEIGTPKERFPYGTTPH